MSQVLLSDGSLVHDDVWQEMVDQVAASIDGFDEMSDDVQADVVDAKMQYLGMATKVADLGEMSNEAVDRLINEVRGVISPSK